MRVRVKPQGSAGTGSGFRIARGVVLLMAMRVHGKTWRRTAC